MCRPVYSSMHKQVDSSFSMANARRINLTLLHSSVGFLGSWYVIVSCSLSYLTIHHGTQEYRQLAKMIQLFIVS